MKVKSNYAIAPATFTIFGSKILYEVCQPVRSKSKTNNTLYTYMQFFSRFEVTGNNNNN